MQAQLEQQMEVTEPQVVTTVVPNQPATVQPPLGKVAPDHLFLIIRYLYLYIIVTYINKEREEHDSGQKIYFSA